MPPLGFMYSRYLSKPIDKQRLFQNLDDALELYYSINQKIAVETKSGVTSVLTCDIVYVEAKGRKVIVHTATVVIWIPLMNHFNLDRTSAAGYLFSVTP